MARVSDAAMKAKTGKSLSQWIEVIDKFGGSGMTHKQIAAELFSGGHIGSGWWCQQVTVEYEYAKRRRQKGQTSAVGWEIGVQKTLDADPKSIWDFMLSPRGLKIWLADLDEKLVPAKGQTYQGQDGTTGEVRTAAAYERLRLYWQPAGRTSPTTLQVYLYWDKLKPDKTSVRFHQEKLSSARERQAMKRRWQAALEQLAQALA